ncbi:MAG: hypothetical protein AAGI51_03270 [Pseudomonadota bacterium]
MLIALSFGAVCFSVRAWPDRLVEGAVEIRLKLAGVRGLVSVIAFRVICRLLALSPTAIRSLGFASPIRSRAHLVCAAAFGGGRIA